MFAPTASFPIVAVSTSLILVACAGWLIFRRSRRRVGFEPCCAKCDYILAGIVSDRCPECGSKLDPAHIARGRRRGRGGRIVAGLVLLACSAAVSLKPLEQWSQRVYWYQYRPTSRLIYDLKNGNGLPAPANNPVSLRYSIGHGWISERADLARVAFHELRERERVGKLLPKYRQQVDQIELENVGAPVRAPVQYDMNADLIDRWLGGKLSNENDAWIHHHALTISLSAQPVDLLWNDVPLAIAYSIRLPTPPYGGWTVGLSYRSIRLDGTTIAWSHGDPLLKSDLISSAGGTGKVVRFIPHPQPGSHRIELDMRIDIHTDFSYGPYLGPIWHSEERTISTSFVQIEPQQVKKEIGEPQ